MLKEPYWLWTEDHARPQPRLRPEALESIRVGFLTSRSHRLLTDGWLECQTLGAHVYAGLTCARCGAEHG